MKHFLTALFAATLVSGSAFALDLKLQPGGLSNNYAEICNTQDASLTLSGAVDVRDLALLKNMSKTVTSIDMSNLSIKAYKYPSGNYMGRTSFEDGELPPYILSGSRVTSVKLPASLRIIGESAFVASQIESIEFPVSLVKIENYAFANADKLKTAVFNNKAEIGVGVFKDCASLSHVQLYSGIDEIPESMFAGCTSYSEPLVPSVKRIGAFAYRGTAIESLNLTNIENIGDYAFADMKKLAAVITTTNRNINFGNGVFLNDVALESLPTFDTDMSNAVFAHAGGLINNVVNSENIGQGAYANNSSLDSIRLGENVKYIGSHAFRNDFALHLIDASRLQSNIPEVESDAFSGLENSEGRYDIELNVTDDSAKEWATHPVWGLFKIGNYTVGIDDTISDPVADIRIVRTGNSVGVESTHNLDYVGIFSVNGMTLHEAAPQSTAFSASDLLDQDVLVVKVISGGAVKIVKLK